ncbi:MAG TPA: hypothetical protein VGB01_02935, partial [candidate division Zixibacteria bacterium]
FNTPRKGHTSNRTTYRLPEPLRQALIFARKNFKISKFTEYIILRKYPHQRRKQPLQASVQGLIFLKINN